MSYLLGEIEMILKGEFKRKRGGFTYVELLIVGIIMATITTFSLILIRGNVEAMKINSTVGLIKNQLRMVRAEAVHTGTTQTVRFDQARNMMIINGTDEIPFPKQVKLKNINIYNNTLTFTPLGNCQGNRLETLDILTDDEEVGYRIRIIGATGTPDSFALHR